MEPCKRCTKCGVEKALECFFKNRSTKDGLSVWCKACTSACIAARYATPEGKAKKKAAYAAYLATPEGKAKRKAANFAWYATPEGKAKRKSAQAAYLATPEGKAKAKAAISARLATPEGKAKQKAAEAAYRATPEGKAKSKAQATAWYATPEGKAKQKAASAAYFATPEGKAKRLAAKNRRRARKLNAPGPHHTAKQWVDKRAEYDQRCAYCFRKPKRLTLDHVVPLIRGGSNAIENCVPACATCNSSKGPKDLRVWLELPILRKAS